MAPIVLKIKGNKSFSPFSHMASEDELSKTWRVCTKVKDSLENGSRLENLSWRLWFVHNVLNDNAKAAAFRRLPSATTLQLDKEKGPLSAMKRTARKKDKDAAPKQSTFCADTTSNHIKKAFTNEKSNPEPQSAKSISNKAKTATRLTLSAARDSELQYKRTLRQQQLIQARLGQSSQIQQSASACKTLILSQQTQKQNLQEMEKKTIPQQQDQQIHVPKRNLHQQGDQNTHQLQQNQNHLQRNDQQVHRQQQQQQHQQYTALLAQQQQQQQRQQQYPLQPQSQLQQNGTSNTPYPSALNRQMIEEFVLHQYTSDQACDQVVQLENTFGDKTSNSSITSNSNNDINTYNDRYLNINTSRLTGSAITSDTNMEMAPPLNRSNHLYIDTNLRNNNDYNRTQQTGMFNMANQNVSNPTIDNNHGVYSYDYTTTMAAAAASIPNTPNLSSPFDVQPTFYDSNVTQNQQTILSLQPPQQQQQQSCHPIYEEMDTLQDFLDSSVPTTYLSHNKLLATLPAETLASAERLLLPTNLHQPPIDHHQHYQNQQLNGQTGQQQHQYQHLTSNMPQYSHQQQQEQLTPTSTLSTPNYQTVPPNFQQVNLSAPTTPFPQPSTSKDTYSGQPTKSLPPSRPTSPTTEKRHRAALIVNSTPSEGKAPICSNCESTSTPLWRRSANDDLLCNACGLYLKLHKTARPKYLKPHSLKGKEAGGDQELVQTVCSNCSTTTTPLWRRDLEGQPLCNACGLYLKLHHEKRPLSMKTDVIKKRQRCDNTATPVSQPPIQPLMHHIKIEKDIVMGDYCSAAIQHSSTSTSTSTTSSSASISISTSPTAIASISPPSSYSMLSKSKSPASSSPSSSPASSSSSSPTKPVPSI